MSLLQSVDLHAVSPPLVLAGGALAVLVADLVLPARRRLAAMPIALVATAGALAAVATLVPGRPHGTFCLPAATLPAAVGGARVPASCSYVADGYTLLFQVVVLATVAVVLLLGRPTVHEHALPAGEYHVLLLLSAVGMLTIAAARDLVTLFVALETLSLPAFVLAGLRRGDPRGSGAALTFFLVGIVSSAVTLFGLALVYGLTGTVQYDRIAAQLARPDIRGAPAAGAVALTIVGLAFKVSAVPFHSWAPDTYRGAPLPVAAFLSVASKSAGFAGLLGVLFVAFRPYAQVWGPAVAALAVATLLVGNLVAFQQRHAVRLLAWSSVAQSGFVLAPLGVAASARGRADALDTALSAALAYVAIYAAMSLGAFACVAAVARRHPRNRIADYRGLSRGSPLLAAALAFFLLCLGGAPPGLAGLFAKVAVFRAVIDGGAGWLGVVMAAATVLGLAYYLRFAALLFAAPDPLAQAGVGEPGELGIAAAGADGGAAAVATAGTAAVAVDGPADVGADGPAGVAVDGAADGAAGLAGAAGRAGRIEVPRTLVAAIALTALAAVAFGVAPELVLHVTPLARIGFP